MNPDLTAAVDYARQYLAAGVPEQQLRDYFIQFGWTAELVDAVFQQVHAGQATSPAAEPITPSPLTGPVLQPSDQPQSSSKTLEYTQKFTVRQAAADSLQAITANPLAYTVALGIGLVLFISVLAVMTLVVGTSLLVSAFVAIQSPAKAIPIFLLGLTVYGLVSAALVAVQLSLTAWVLAAGHHHHAVPLKTLLKDAAVRVPRVALVTLVNFGLALLPLIVLTGLTLILGRSGHNPVFGIISILGGLAAVTFLLIYLLRTVLVLHVALFERQLSPFGCIRRSSHLMQRGGQWFIIKLGVVYWLPLFVLSTVARHSSILTIIAGALAFGLYVIAQASLTMLYFNRVAIRGPAG